MTKQKFGFNTGEDNSSENEPEVGYAETEEEDSDDFWKDTLLPYYIDFAIVYGTYALLRDIVISFRRGGE